MTTDKPSFQPLYQQIRTLLAQRIAQGEWAAHEALPSEWALAESLGVSQGTVRKALTDLVDEGWLYRQQGKGTFVAPGLNEWGDGHLVTPGQFAEPPGSPVPELLSCTRANASEDIAQALSLRRAAPLFRVRLLWRLAGVAVALDDAYVPVGRFEEIDARRLRQYEDFFNATGMATPDDLEEFRSCQHGFNARAVKWNDMTRGATHWVKGPDANADLIGLKPELSGIKTEDEGLYVMQHVYWLETMKKAYIAEQAEQDGAK